VKLDLTDGPVPEIDEAKGLEIERRRSIYFRHSPDTQMEFLKMFRQGPIPSECYSRNGKGVWFRNKGAWRARPTAKSSVEKARWC